MTIQSNLQEGYLVLPIQIQDQFLFVYVLNADGHYNHGNPNPVTNLGTKQMSNAAKLHESPVIAIPSNPRDHAAASVQAALEKAITDRKIPLSMFNSCVPVLAYVNSGLYQILPPKVTRQRGNLPHILLSSLMEVQCQILTSK